MASGLTNPTSIAGIPADLRASKSTPTITAPQISPRNIQLPPSPQEAEYTNVDTPVRRPSHPTRFESYPQSSPIPSSGPTIIIPYRSRNRSPPGPKMRSHSSGGLSAGPLMQRAHSSPGVDSSGRFITPGYSVPRRPTSPLYQGRRRSPLRAGIEELHPFGNSFSGLSIEPNIPEHAELNLSPEHELSHSSSLSSFSNTFPRSRRRPASPLHQSASAPSLHARAVSPNASGGTSPFLAAQRYANEPYPSYSFSSASSVPSTPTSVRSRSPSISSLETIEDTPDAEEAAMQEEEEESKQRVEDLDGPQDLRRRSSLELRGNNLRSNKERKRWSVCGAERRADFSLEPIEE